MQASSRLRQCTLTITKQQSSSHRVWSVSTKTHFVCPALAPPSPPKADARNNISHTTIPLSQATIPKPRSPTTSTQNYQRLTAQAEAPQTLFKVVTLLLFQSCAFLLEPRYNTTEAPTSTPRGSTPLFTPLDKTAPPPPPPLSPPATTKQPHYNTNLCILVPLLAALRPQDPLPGSAQHLNTPLPPRGHTTRLNCSCCLPREHCCCITKLARPPAAAPNPTPSANHCCRRCCCCCRCRHCPCPAAAATGLWF
jgi:hypothetical protein